MSAETPNKSSTDGSKRHLDTGATLACACACANESAMLTKPKLLTPGEVAALPIPELACANQRPQMLPIESAILPTAFDFDILKIAAQAEKRRKMEEFLNYSICVPCCACLNCVIVRIINHGRMQDESYNCIASKRRVDKFGHCTQGKEGRGPNVIVVNPKLELLAERSSDGEIREFPKLATEIPDYDIREMQRQPKLKPTKEETKK